MNHCIKFLFLSLFLISCSSGNIEREKNKDYFLDLYISYVKDIQNSKYPENIEEHRSEDFIAALRERNEGEILPEHLSWEVQSSFIKISSIDNSFLSEEGRDKCLTVIGKNYEDVPMYLNMRFLEQTPNDWKIHQFYGFVFYTTSSPPDFPTEASCPDNT